MSHSADPRVVSLLPSATEICYALGVEPVATSHECDWPPQATDRPSVVRSRVDPDASPDAVNEQVADAEAAGGVYEIDREALARADPDLVVSQGVCEVCAVDSVLVEAVVDDLGLDCTVLTTDPHHLEDVFADVERLGEALGREREATELLGDLRARVAAVREGARHARGRPRTLVLDWPDPPMVAGHWVPGMVETAGGAFGLADPGERSGPREWADVREYDPEVLVLAPCGYDLHQAIAHADALTGREGWDDLAAVEAGRAYAMDGHHYLNRPGPRLVDTLEFLAGLVHPDVFETPPGEAVGALARPTP